MYMDLILYEAALIHKKPFEANAAKMAILHSEDNNTSTPYKNYLQALMLIESEQPFDAIQCLLHVKEKIKQQQLKEGNKFLVKARTGENMLLVKASLALAQTY